MYFLAVCSNLLDITQPVSVSVVNSITIAAYQRPLTLNGFMVTPSSNVSTLILNCSGTKGEIGTINKQVRIALVS